jgi:hypothetical protein
MNLLIYILGIPIAYLINMFVAPYLGYSTSTKPSEWDWDIHFVALTWPIAMPLLLAMLFTWFIWLGFVGIMDVIYNFIKGDK